MPSVSLEEFLIWKKKQLSKGGDYQSFALLLDCIGGIPTSDINLLTLNLSKKLFHKGIGLGRNLTDDHAKRIPKTLIFFLNVIFLQDLYSSGLDH